MFNYKGELKDWGEIFRTAHLFSWPTASLSISNAEPNAQQRDQGKRNVYREDERAILKAALANGYKVISPPNAQVVSFLNPFLKGLLYVLLVFLELGAWHLEL
jgi:hypothetical protein